MFHWHLKVPPPLPFVTAYDMPLQILCYGRSITRMIGILCLAKFATKAFNNLFSFVFYAAAFLTLSGTAANLL